MDENQKNTIEQLNLRLDRVNGWINNCDQKASILLAFCGALIAVFLTSDMFMLARRVIIKPAHECWFQDGQNVFSIRNTVLAIILGIICWFLYKMITHLLLVLKPKTIIDDFDEEESMIEKDSLLHYQTINKLKFNEFLKCQEDTAERYINDLESQIYVNSKICTDKFDNLKLSIHYMGMLLLFIAIEAVSAFVLPLF